MKSRMKVIDGIKVYLCHTFDTLTLRQLDITTRIIEDSEGKYDMSDYLENDGNPIFSDGRWITGCETTARLLIMQGAKESKDSHYHPIYSEIGNVGQTSRQKNHKAFTCKISKLHFTNDNVMSEIAEGGMI